MITETLASIDAPHFVAGIVLWDDVVVEVSPIVKYMKGWSRKQVRQYCERKSWRIICVHELQRNRT